MENTETKLACTMCGNELDDWDLDADFHFNRYIGFGSKYDLSIFEAHLCCKCYDKILDTILPMFKNNPLSEYEIVDEDGKLICKPIK
jgi:hypothetical protein